jgi:hypothetical protein
MKTSRRPPENTSDLAHEASATTASPTPPSHDLIAQRSFELYCARGCKDGQDLDDWLQAERELGDRQ